MPISFGEDFGSAGSSLIFFFEVLFSISSCLSCVTFSTFFEAGLKALSPSSRSTLLEIDLISEANSGLISFIKNSSNFNSWEGALCID